MESLRIITDLEQKGFRDDSYAVTQYDGEVIIGGMDNGTELGKPVVMIGLEDPETGGYLVVQTTLALFLSAADALKFKYGDPRE